MDQDRLNATVTFRAFIQPDFFISFDLNVLAVGSLRDATGTFSKITTELRYGRLKDCTP